jgi:hypothetical protein
MGKKAVFGFCLGGFCFSALLGLSTLAQAASCDLKAIPAGLGKHPSFSDGTSYVDAAKNYTLNQPFTVKPGEPVIRRQVKRAMRSFRFPQDVLYKADWFLAPKYRLEAGRKYFASQETTSQLWAISFSDSTGAAYLFLDKDGHLCDHVGSYYSSNNNWVLLHGTYAAQPDVAAAGAEDVDPNVSDGVAILLDKIDSVSVTLSIRRLVDGQYKDEGAQSFDTLSGQISIKGYKIRINSVANGQASFSVVEEPAPGQAG